MAGSTLITKDDEAHMLGPILSIAWYGKGGAHWACNAIEVGIISLHSSPPMEDRTESARTVLVFVLLWRIKYAKHK